MKKYITFLCLSTFIVLIITLIGVMCRNNKLQKDIQLYDNNFKALSLENKVLKNETIAYKFDIEQLEYLNDSIIKDLNDTRKELKIKDKELLQMQSIKTEISTKDSIYIKDTIFRDSFVKIDTTLGDGWYTVKLLLEYPNKVAINTSYISELNVFASSSKEIIGTPKKCWLGRVFQKKYKVIRVDVTDKCPYAKIKEKKFVIIE